MNILEEFLKKNRECKINIHCLGDGMVDEYVAVKVNRISPEFPMPIMHSLNDQVIRKPGGAANVAYQFRHFNVESLLFCLPEHEATRLYLDHGVDVASPHIPQLDAGESQRIRLPRKRRFLCDNIQVIRQDFESPLCGVNRTAYQSIVAAHAAILPNCGQPEVAVFSDYDKGYFDDPTFIRTSLDSYTDKTVTIVDPKNGPLEKWAGCSIFKPNAVEAARLSGESDWRRQCVYIKSKLSCDGVVITQGGEGVCGLTDLGFFEYRPNKSVLVESVIGAGDCFCAFLAMATGHGFGLELAARIAFEAGAKYVQCRLNRPITPAEMSPSGIVSPEDLSRRDFTLAFTNGCFDLLHEGHISTLEFAKTKASKLVVGVNSDSSVRKLKGDGRPVKPLEERMRLLAALKPVDYVVSFNEETPFETIKKIRPDCLVKGADYDLTTVVGRDLVKDVYLAPVVEGLSTTRTIQILQQSQQQSTHLQSESH